MMKVRDLTDWPTKIKKIPTQKRAIERVKKILSISEIIIETEDVTALTTTNLSRAANIPIGSIYQYFDSREDILDYLHTKAYQEVLEKVQNTLNNIKPGINFEVLNKKIITVFWNEAKNHKSFTKLTRWANNASTIWEATSQANSHIPRVVKQVLSLSDITINEKRKSAFIKTISTVLSVLIDQAIEQEEIAEDLIEELKTLSNAYVKTLT